ncbi:MAG: hypothetical protein DWQ10_16020 [Calditrichaeota bacterium]|nr:MAG: hypothetical protein DWQ10_16020 [Calditrichota bacterium]
MKKTAIILILALAASVQLSAQKTQEKQRPNIIVILADDLNWGDIGYNNPEKVYTPNLDRLADEGATLVNHYSMQCL